jgi:hypothetical protein
VDGALIANDSSSYYHVGGRGVKISTPIFCYNVQGPLRRKLHIQMGD